MRVRMTAPGERVRRAGSKEKQPDRTLNLVDVYDMAADIGKVSREFIQLFENSGGKARFYSTYLIGLQEFEILIDQHGAEQVTQLMQKVISALEQLELLVQKNDSELLLIEDLRKTIEHMQHEDNKKVEASHKYARDIEQVIPCNTYKTRTAKPS